MIIALLKIAVHCFAQLFDNPCLAWILRVIRFNISKGATISVATGYGQVLVMLEQFQRYYFRKPSG